jgi:hypothetical protein
MSQELMQSIADSFSKIYSVDLNPFLSGDAELTDTAYGELKSSLTASIAETYSVATAEVQKYMLSANTKSVEDVTSVPPVYVTAEVAQRYQDATGVNVKYVHEELAATLIAMQESSSDTGTAEIMIASGVVGLSATVCTAVAYALGSIGTSLAAVSIGGAAALAAAASAMAAVFTVAAIAIALAAAIAAVLLAIFTFIFGGTRDVLGMVINKTNANLYITDWDANHKGDGIYLKHGEMFSCMHDYDPGYQLGAPIQSEDGEINYAIGMFQGGKNKFAGISFYGVEGYLRFTAKELGDISYLTYFANPQENESGISAQVISYPLNSDDDKKKICEGLHEIISLKGTHNLKGSTATISAAMDSEKTDTAYAIFTLLP